MGADSELEEDESDEGGETEVTLQSENQWYGNRTGRWNELSEYDDQQRWDYGEVSWTKDRSAVRRPPV